MVGDSVMDISIAGRAIKANASQKKYSVFIPRQRKPIRGLEIIDTKKKADTIRPTSAIEACRVSLAYTATMGLRIWPAVAAINEIMEIAVRGESDSLFTGILPTSQEYSQSRFSVFYNVLFLQAVIYIYRSAPIRLKTTRADIYG
jgi:hypothetical protein